ncbi:hypothetical protein M2426_005072 [Pseudomonas moraviensis]
MFSPAFTARWCLALLCLSPLESAWAAPTPGETDLIRERQNRLLEEQQRRLEELKDLPGKDARPAQPTTPADSRCFTIKDIELKGADSLSEREKARLLEPYIGECLGVPQLNELLKVLFFNEHTMRDGSVGRFDPDAGIAETWSRFQSGTFKQEDIQLFKHEYFESRFEGIFRQDYGVSHDKTQIRYSSPLD